MAVPASICPNIPLKLYVGSSVHATPAPFQHPPTHSPYHNTPTTLSHPPQKIRRLNIPAPLLPHRAIESQPLSLLHPQIHRLLINRRHLLLRAALRRHLRLQSFIRHLPRFGGFGVQAGVGFDGAFTFGFAGGGLEEGPEPGGVLGVLEVRVCGGEGGEGGRIGAGIPRGLPMRWDLPCS